jgi:hypothetical protein
LRCRRGLKRLRCTWPCLGAKKALAERLISSVFPNAHISESRGDYNIFNYEGEHVAAYATLAEHSALPLKTYAQFEHDPLNVVLAAFSKIAKHGEGASFQIVVSSEGDRYNKHYQKILRELEQGRSLHEALAVPETVLGDVMHDFSKAIFSSEKKDERKQMEERRIVIKSRLRRSAEKYRVGLLQQ